MYKKTPNTASSASAGDGQKDVRHCSDRAADDFARAYGDYARRIYAYLLRETGSPHTAEDLMQETFLKAWRKRESFGGLSSLKTWLFAIAVNACRDHARKAGREKTECAEWIAMVPDTRPLAWESLDKRRAFERLRKAVAALPEELRAPLMLVRFDGLRYREAAEALGISSDAVRMRLHRAHRLLADAFKRENRNDAR